MAEMDTTVAMPEENIGVEQPADDAQATEISVEELVAQLTEEPEAQETVEDDGDDGQSAPSEPEGKQQEQETSEKFGRRIASALKNQENKLISEMGGGKLTKAEIMEIVREHQARKMHEEDPEISPKAARKIIEAQEKAAQPAADPRVAELSAQMKDMLAKGYTQDEIKALVSDAGVREDVDSGKSLWQAARAYERRQGAAQDTATKKRAVRTARNSAAGESPEVNLIKSIPDDKYDDFIADLRARAMRGEKVRI